MRRARFVLGVALVGVAGVVFGYAWTVPSSDLWWLGALTLCSGVLFVLSSSWVSLVATPRDPYDLVYEHRLPTGDVVHRLLGEIMVERYAMITKEQLKEALHRQRGTTRLLGEVLLDMGLITVSDLRRVLEDQRLGSGLWHRADRVEESSPANRRFLGGTLR